MSYTAERAMKMRSLRIAPNIESMCSGYIGPLLGRTGGTPIVVVAGEGLMMGAARSGTGRFTGGAISVDIVVGVVVDIERGGAFVGCCAVMVDVDIGVSEGTPCIEGDTTRGAWISELGAAVRLVAARIAALVFFPTTPYPVVAGVPFDTIPF